MEIGKYKDRITLCQLTSNDDGMGGGETVSSDLITVWANVQRIPSSQAIQYGELYNGIGYNIECRELKTHEITEKNGVTYNGKLLNIHSVVKEDNRLKIIAFE